MTARLLAKRAALAVALATTVGGRREASAQNGDVAASEPLSNGERDRDRLGWYVPDFAKLQTGGYAGSIAAGAGYAMFGDVLNVSLLYGYVPPFQGRGVQSLHFTLSARPFELGRGRARLVPFYLGLGALHTWSDGYFVELPPQYEAGYYPPTGLHATAHVGIGLDFVPRSGRFERHGVYFELVTVQPLLWAYFKNPGLVDPSDVVSGSFGYRAAF